MNIRMTASSDAIHACDHEDVVLWLQPRSALEYPSDIASARDTFRQVTASLGLGALLTFGTAACVTPALAHTSKLHPVAVPKHTKAGGHRPLKVATLKPTKGAPPPSAKISRTKSVQIATPKPVPEARHGQPAFDGPSREPARALSVPADIVVPPVATADVPLIIVEEMAAALANLTAASPRAAPDASAHEVVVAAVSQSSSIETQNSTATAQAPSDQSATETLETDSLETATAQAPSDQSATETLVTAPLEPATAQAPSDQSAAETPETASLEPANTDETTLQLAATPLAHALPDQEPDEPRPGYDPHELLQFDDMRVPRWIVETILKASDVTGVDPVYMMALADKESSFIPANRAGTSSAEGLFQFISSTWLEVVRSFGAKHGLVTEAAAIERSSGQLWISDEAMRDHVLGLRRDPYLSALMAAEMMKRDRAKVERRLGRSITRSEFYLAHFFGVDSASKFMALLDGKPKQSAPRVFPRAAKANRTLFFAKKGRRTRHLSVAEVYSRIDGMIDKRLDRYQGVMTAVSDASL